MYFIVTSLIVCFKIYFVFFLNNAKSFKNSMVMSYFYGLVSWSFLYSMLPLEKFGSKDIHTDIAVVSLVIVLFSSLYIVYSLVFFYKKYFLTRSIFIRSFLFSFVITFLEVLISIFMSIFTSGKVIPDYTFTNIGYALTYSPLVYIVKYGHIYILTFLFSFLVSFIYNKKLSLIYYFLLLVLCLSFYFKTNYNYQLSSKILIKNEDSRFVKASNMEELKLKYDLVIDGNTEYDKFGNMYNVSRVFDFKNNLEYKNYKRFLMPFGEYYPKSFLFLKYFNIDVYNNMNRKRRYVSVENKNNIFTFEGKNYATLLCSEAWSPISVYLIKKQKPDIVILQRRENLFHDNLLYKTNLNMWKRILFIYFDDKVIDISK